MSITDQIEALREVEIPWLVKELGDSIANLDYPVGCGLAPHPDQLNRAAAAIFGQWIKMAEKVHATSVAIGVDEALVAALQFIADGYDNHDVSHVDFRVKTYRIATDALATLIPSAHPLPR